MTRFEMWDRRLASGWVYWPLCLVACALLALALFGPEAKGRLDLEHQCAAMQAEVDQITEARDQLQAAHDALQNDPTYVEQVARHELGLVRPGEIHLPQPLPLASLRVEESPEPAPAIHPAMEFLASLVSPRVRLVALVMGSVLLAAAVLFSITPAKPKTARG